MDLKLEASGSAADAYSTVLAQTREARARPASNPTKNHPDIPCGTRKEGWIEYRPLFPTRGFVVSQTPIIRSKQQRNVLRSSHHQTSPTSKHEMAEMQQEEPPMCAVCNHCHHQVTLKVLVGKAQPSLVSALFELADL